jgi:hypothetical protein
MNTGGSWSSVEACKIITELKVSGFPAGITVGGIWVNAPTHRERLSRSPNLRGRTLTLGD